MTRVVIVDDQTIVREGLVLLLQLLPDIEVAGAAAGGEEALQIAAGTEGTDARQKERAGNEAEEGTDRGAVSGAQHGYWGRARPDDS